MTAGSRQLVLERIRTGLSAVESDLKTDYAELPRLYTQRGSMSINAKLALIVDRLREYDAAVVECSEAALVETIAAEIARSGKRALAAPEGLPQQWLASSVEWRVDHGLTNQQIEQVEGVVTAAFCGVAESGTIVLHHSLTEGRRVLTLLPDWHLCVLRASQVVETLPEYFALCAEPPHLHPVDKDPSTGTPRLATYISGPSATADIEMTRIKGVHGPRFLSVVLVRDDVPEHA